MTSVADDTTLGLNDGPAVASNGNTLATASCQVDFGAYTSLLNVAMHDSVDVEAVVRIYGDLKSMSTVFAHDDPKTYYQYVHRDEKFGQTFADDAAQKAYNETTSVDYLDFSNDYSVLSKLLQGFTGFYAPKIVEYIMPRMFSPKQPVGAPTDLPKAYLRTDIFSVDRVKSELLSFEKARMLIGCAALNWLDPSKINEDSDFLATHRSSQDNSVLGYSINADGISAGDMLVLNVKFQPQQLEGFDSVGRTLRVEIIHAEGFVPSLQHPDSHTWLFANQEVFTATGAASDESPGGDLGDDDSGNDNTYINA